MMVSSGNSSIAQDSKENKLNQISNAPITPKEQFDEFKRNSLNKRNESDDSKIDNTIYNFVTISQFNSPPDAIAHNDGHTSSLHEQKHTLSTEKDRLAKQVAELQLKLLDMSTVFSQEHDSGIDKLIALQNLVDENKRVRSKCKRIALKAKAAGKDADEVKALKDSLEEQTVYINEQNSFLQAAAEEVESLDKQIQNLKSSLSEADTLNVALVCELRGIAKSNSPSPSIKYNCMHRSTMGRIQETLSDAMSLLTSTSTAEMTSTSISVDHSIINSISNENDIESINLKNPISITETETALQDRCQNLEIILSQLCKDIQLIFSSTMTDDNTSASTIDIQYLTNNNSFSTPGRKDKNDMPSRDNHITKDTITNLNLSQEQTEGKSELQIIMASLGLGKYKTDTDGATTMQPAITSTSSAPSSAIKSESGNSYSGQNGEEFKIDYGEPEVSFSMSPENMKQTSISKMSTPELYSRVEELEKRNKSLLMKLDREVKSRQRLESETKQHLMEIQNLRRIIATKRDKMTHDPSISSADDVLISRCSSQSSFDDNSTAAGSKRSYNHMFASRGMSSQSFGIDKDFGIEKLISMSGSMSGAVGTYSSSSSSMERLLVGWEALQHFKFSFPKHKKIMVDIFAKSLKLVPLRIKAGRLMGEAIDLCKIIRLDKGINTTILSKAAAKPDSSRCISLHLYEGSTLDFEFKFNEEREDFYDGLFGLLCKLSPNFRNTIIPGESSVTHVMRRRAGEVDLEDHDPGHGSATSSPIEDRHGSNNKSGKSESIQLLSKTTASSSKKLLQNRVIGAGAGTVNALKAAGVMSKSEINLRDLGLLDEDEDDISSLGRESEDGYSVENQNGGGVHNNGNHRSNKSIWKKLATTTNEWLGASGGGTGQYDSGIDNSTSNQTSTQRNMLQSDDTELHFGSIYSSPSTSLFQDNNSTTSISGDHSNHLLSNKSSLPKFTSMNNPIAINRKGLHTYYPNLENVSEELEQETAPTVDEIYSKPVSAVTRYGRQNRTDFDEINPMGNSPNISEGGDSQSSSNRSSPTVSSPSIPTTPSNESNHNNQIISSNNNNGSHENQNKNNRRSAKMKLLSGLHGLAKHMPNLRSSSPSLPTVSSPTELSHYDSSMTGSVSNTVTTPAIIPSSKPHSAQHAAFRMRLMQGKKPIG